MSKQMLAGLLVFAVGICVFSFAHRALCREDGNWTEQLREEKLGSVANMMENSLVISPDGARVAYVIKNGEKQVVVIDGNAGKDYDAITGICFSPDSKHIAFAAKRGGKAVTVVDGTEGKEYDAVGVMAFSPNGGRFAYAAMREKQWVVVVDSAEDGPYQGVSGVIFSPDSKRFAYAVTLEMKDPANPQAPPAKKGMVVVDRVGGEQYDSIVPGTLVFSPDSRRVAYAAVQENKQMFVIDGEAGNAYDAVGGFAFSVNSKHFAYAATAEGKGFVVIEGAEEKKYDATGVPRFSDDAQHLVYLARLGEKSLVVMDGTDGAQYEDIHPDSLVISGDSARIAYAAKRDGKWMCVVESTKIKPMEQPPDEEPVEPQPRPAGAEGKQYDDIKGASITFSPDSKHLAYAASSGGKWMRVFDGNEGTAFDDIYPSFAFSAEGERVVFFAQTGDKWGIATDGKAEGAYARPLPGSRIVSTGGDTVHALAIAGDEIVRVTVLFLWHPAGDAPPPKEPQP